MIARLTVLFFCVFLASSTSLSWWDRFPCSAVSANALHASYYVALCEGRNLYGQGEFAKAATRFEYAANVSLYEEPNFEVLLDVAQSRCTAGQQDQGRFALSEFDTSLQIYSGELRCDQVHPSRQKAAATRMCTEMLSPTYLGSTANDQTKKYVKSLRAIRANVAEGCKLNRQRRN